MNGVLKLLFNISNLAKLSENVWKLAKLLPVPVAFKVLATNSVHQRHFLVYLPSYFIFFEVENHVVILMVIFLPGAYSPEVQGVQRTLCDVSGTHVNYI